MTVLKALLDTSFLITLLNNQRANHTAARLYYRFMLESSIHMHVSAIAISEFAVRDSITNLPHANIIFLPFNAADGVESARLQGLIARDEGDSRQVVKDDIKIIGHAAHEKIDFLITDDKTTMYKYCERLRVAGEIYVKSIALVDGFDDCVFNANGQIGFGFASASP